MDGVALFQHDHGLVLGEGCLLVNAAEHHRVGWIFVSRDGHSQILSAPCLHIDLGIVPTADHCIPFGNVYTAWMADQEVVHSSNISILVSCHRAINVMENRVLITIQLTIFKPGPWLSKEDIQRDLVQ